MAPSFVSRWTSRSSFALTALAVAACSSDMTTPVAYCAALYTPAVIAHVTDSVTGASLAQTAGGAIASGMSVDSLRFYAPPDEMVAGTLAGTYVVRISQSGYADWVRSNVVVTPTGSCNNVNTVTLSAKLVPIP